MNDNAENKSNVIAITNYDQSVPTITLYLQDYYHQDVVTEVSGFAQLFVPDDALHDCKTDGFSGYIGGGIVEKFDKGVATFKDVDALCAPGGVLFVSGTTERVTSGAIIELSFRPCVVGGNVTVMVI